ncbi:MAG: hypothetical protein FWD49_03915 [Firmicutes bacterium]|nr:hypothetical protein [Bacillota bacterium]
MNKEDKTIKAEATIAEECALYDERSIYLSEQLMRVEKRNEEIMEECSEINKKAREFIKVRPTLSKEQCAVYEAELDAILPRLSALEAEQYTLNELLATLVNELCLLSVPNPNPSQPEIKALPPEREEETLKVLELFLKNEMASVSHLQVAFKLAFIKASKLYREMQEYGFIIAEDGEKWVVSEEGKATVKRLKELYKNTKTP